MSRFREAVEAADFTTIDAPLADEVVFRSPVAHTPYPGKPLVAQILRGAFETFEGLTYIRELRDGPHEALVFEATVEGLEVTGCDFLIWDERERIVDFMVMVRPLRAAEAVARQMAARWEAITSAAAPPTQP